MKLAREPASSHSEPCASLKKARKIFAVRPFLLALVARSQTVVRDQLSPQQSPRFAPLIHARKSTALPWLVDDRASLRPCRILQSVSRYACACCGALPGFSRQCQLPLASQLLRKRAPNWLSEEAHRVDTILHQPNRRRASTDRLNHDDSPLVSSLEGESDPAPAGKTPTQQTGRGLDHCG